MTRDDRDPRQTVLTGFTDGGDVLADGGMVRPTLTNDVTTPPAYEQPYTEGDTPYSHYADAGTYGIMYAGEYKWDNIRCTAEAYGDTNEYSRSSTSTRSLQFHTEWMDAAAAKACVREIGVYNQFDPEHVAAAIDAMPTTAWFVVARESSPAVYVWTVSPHEVMDILDESGSEVYDRRQELYKELSKIEDKRDTDETLILKQPEETSGRLREVLTELEQLNTFPPGAPDELGAFPHATTYPTVRVGTDDGDLAPGTPTLIRAWWD
jgi:hypothetical protein